MKTSILTSILFLAFLSCNFKTDKKTEECLPYFQFDKAEHYSISIDEGTVWDIEEKENKTNDESRLVELLLQGTPYKLSDTLKFNNIETLGFKKKEIQKDKFSQLDQIFCERKHEDAMYSLCIAIYRDILIFKQNNKTIGFAILCFDCWDSIITGTNKNTLEFGQSGDFQKLGGLLN